MITLRDKMKESRPYPWKTESIKIWKKNTIWNVKIIKVVNSQSFDIDDAFTDINYMCCNCMQFFISSTKHNHGWTISHYSDVIMGAKASQITGVSSIYATVCPGADQRKHQSPASLTFVRGIHRWAVNSPHKGPVTRKMFPFDGVIMKYSLLQMWYTFISG